MKFSKALISVIFCNSLLFACSSKPVEKYYDYFYSNNDNNNFTYILYLGEKGGYRPQAEDEHSSRIPQRQRSKETRTRKADDDDFMSISFRMEEEAFKRLEKILVNRKFCNNDVNYEVNEYSWLRYTIKGSCAKKPSQ